ncbi:MAG: carbohydrate ABC transporter permease [Massiliimalia sp.]|jgi:multiple sugar transport system permease protein
MAAETVKKVAMHGKKVKRHNPIANILIYLILAILFLICIVPFYSMLISSTHDNATLASQFVLTPGKYLVKNYQRMMMSTNIWRGMANSLFLATSATLLSSYFGALTAYGFSKYKFRGNKVLFAILLGTMMLPGQLGIIGYFNLMNSFKLLDTYAAILIPSIASAMSVFWNKQYLDAFVPNALIEAARIDGAKELVIFHRVIFPIIIPAVATQAIFTFVGAWNNFLNPLILLFSDNKFPLPVLVQQMQGIYGSDYGVIYLGVTMSVLPILIIFVFCSRRIIDGVAVGAVKG